MWDCNFHLSGRISLFAFSACTLHVGKVSMASNYTWPSSWHQWGIEVLSSQLWRNWILPTTWVSLDSEPAPVELSNETPASDDNLIAGLWNTEAEDPTKPCPGFLTHRNGEIIDVCSFKPLNVWWFITQQQVTNTIGMFLESSLGLRVEDLKKGIPIDFAIPLWEIERQLLQKVHSKIFITEFPSLRKVSNISWGPTICQVLCPCLSHFFCHSTWHAGS